MNQQQKENTVITIAKSYQTNDGKIHATIEEAQIHELNAILTDGDESNTRTEEAELLVKHADLVVDILTMKPTSKPKARAINGGKKVRRTTKPIPQTTLPLDTEMPKSV